MAKQAPSKMARRKPASRKAPARTVAKSKATRRKPLRAPAAKAKRPTRGTAAKQPTAKRGAVRKAAVKRPARASSAKKARPAKAAARKTGRMLKIAYLAKARPDLQARIPKDVQGVILEAGPGGVYSPAALAQVADVDALVVSMEPVNEAMLAAAKKLKIVQRLGVGYETLDLQAAARRGIPCCNIEGVNKEAVAEHGVTLILALKNKLLDADRLVRAGQWGDSRLLTTTTFELVGKTMGIIGLGNTGTALARRCKAFGMRIVYNDVRDIDPALIQELDATYLPKAEMFRQADVLSVNTDLNESTRHLVNGETLSMMKPTALFVCCARGGIVDEPALRDALNAGRIAGAGIDVFDPEPIRKDNPLFSAKHTILTSHVAGVTEETTQRIFDWAHENVRRVVLRGQKPRWVRNGVA
jgi:phosphoglycerate dehydrogenase-like enzyme